MVAIQKQQLRQMMRSTRGQLTYLRENAMVDLEHELEIIHSALSKNMRTLVDWKKKLEKSGGNSRLRADANLLDKMIAEAPGDEARSAIKARIHRAITTTIQHTQQIECLHKSDDENLKHGGALVDEIGYIHANGASKCSARN